ncbi:hypothetical protein Z949_1332 [Sulfitobacter guttiformis KCTC 32187]|nr:hypothetical protein Z949_1332 [Sulfitobacter guttiformis KCTC 32187]
MQIPSESERNAAMAPPYSTPDLALSSDDMQYHSFEMR